MKDWFDGGGPVPVLVVLLCFFCIMVAVAAWGSDRDAQRRQQQLDNTVTSGAILGGVPVEQLTVRTYSVTRTIYLDADDPELLNLLNNTAGTAVQVLLPVGAYLVKRFDSITDRWAAGPEWTVSTWVLVGQTGLSTWCYEKLDEEYPDLWPEKVQKFLGIERKARKTKAVKKTKKGRKA
jgi:hypothetical protein